MTAANHSMMCATRISASALCDCHVMHGAVRMSLWTGHDYNAARQPLPDLDTLLLDILEAQKQSYEANMRIIRAIENFLTISNLSKDGAE